MLSIGVNALLLAGAGLGLARQVARSSDAVRVRNALLLRRTRPGDFDWTPERVPADFRVDSAPAPAWVSALLDEIGVSGQPGAWEKALLIAAHLSEKAQDRGRIRADLATTYARIRQGHGYCADFARVFLAFAHAADVFARKWAFSFDGFGGHGHVFVEVWDPGRGQWTFLDVYNNFHVVDAQSGRPLSALELRQALLGHAAFPRIVRNGPGRRAFPREEKLREYYARGLREWYLWWGNGSLAQAQPTRMTRVFLPIAQRALGTLSDRIRIYETLENRAQVAQLRGLRRRVLGGALLCAALSSLLLVQLSALGVRLAPQAGASAAASAAAPAPPGDPR